MQTMASAARAVAPALSSRNAVSSGICSAALVGCIDFGPATQGRFRPSPPEFRKRPARGRGRLWEESGAPKSRAALYHLDE